ncbi:MAG TPA: DinB family protein, partial [Tepidisphaeraceae bacterium]|nr:DinB family protein [Tepidisphaeraceae bacterium]
MARLNTLNELFRHYDWAQEKMLAASGGISREQLNQPFEIGMGTLRLTLQHIHASERAWLERCAGNAAANLPPPDENATITSIRQAAGETAAKRKKFLSSL